MLAHALYQIEAPDTLQPATCMSAASTPQAVKKIIKNQIPSEVFFPESFEALNGFDAVTPQEAQEKKVQTQGWCFIHFINCPI